MGYIRWSDLALAIGFILGCIVSIYLIILIKNVNESIRIFKNVFQTNKDNINDTLQTLPVISKNLVEISSTARNELKAVESTIQSINDTTEMAAAAAQTIKIDIVEKAKSIIELVDLVRRVFFKEKEAADNSK